VTTTLDEQIECLLIIMEETHRRVKSGDMTVDVGRERWRKLQGIKTNLLQTLEREVAVRRHSTGAKPAAPAGGGAGV
jgi:hypothetical protein